MAGLNLRGDTSGSVEIVSPAVAGDNTITLPNDNGSANQFFKNSTTAGIVTHSSMVELTNGNIGVGTTNPGAKVDTSGTALGFRYQGTDNAFLGRRFNEGTDGSVLFLDHSRSNSIGVGASLNSGDEVGSIQFRSFRANNTNINVNARIQAIQTGEADSGGNTLSDLRFDTGGSERLRITNAGVTSVTGSLSVNDNFYPTTGQISNRNIVYNGGMRIAQRGTSGTTSSAGGYPCVDRWNCNDGGIADFTVSQSSETPVGFTSSVKWECTTTGSNTNDAFIEQMIESRDLQHLAYGTSSAKSVTVSFWVRSNKTGEYSFWVENNDAGRYYTTEGYTINAADTWEHKTITFPGDTNGAANFNKDTGIGFKLRWHLVLRASFQGTPSGNWETSASNRGQSNCVNLADSTDNEWYMTGVQVEVGDQATPFEHRSFGDELLRCNRYYAKVGGSRVTGGGGSSSSVTLTVSTPCEMRTTPDVEDVTINSMVRYDATGAGNLGSATGAVGVARGSMYSVNISNLTSVSDNRVYFSNCSFNLDAEL